MKNNAQFTLREMCPSMELFLVRISVYSVWIQENTDQKQLRIWTLFTQYKLRIIFHVTNHIWI